MANKSVDDLVGIPRAEYDALLAFKAAHEDSIIKEAQATNRNHDLLVTCNAQARRLAEDDLAIRNYERIIRLQSAFIEALRADHPKIAALEDLSEFWRRWVVSTENLLHDQPGQRDAVLKVEPDLFRSWRASMQDAQRPSQAFRSRADVDLHQSASQEDVQLRAVSDLRAKNMEMSTRIAQLELELAAHKRSQAR